ncbi:hypothetical protein LR48_Vigan06g006800 [Vigna angularis]|uniref:Clathrin heavy chain linker core motif domain-containing protein n=1 Tax=Phaseolus angularis TaxID=3914 RepID=A0A0L9UQ91_PHAAN|nr:hypothetical protein LR48_Vigan06g006800 [Vigna angularis]
MINCAAPTFIKSPSLNLHTLRLNEYSSKGLYAINRRGQVLLVTVNEQTIVNFVSGQLNNLELAVSLAKRGNLPGAEKLLRL